jgi:hypothetical protein
MRIDPFSASSSKRKREDEPSGSGQGPGSSRSAPARSRQRLPPSASVLQRAHSFPARLPSQPLPRAEVQPVRHPITRAHPDIHPPRDFSSPPAEPPKLFGVPLQSKEQMEQLNERRIQEGAKRKAEALANVSDSTGYKPDARSASEYMEVVRAYHPGFDTYSPEMKSMAKQMLQSNPRLLAEVAQSRNQVSRLPNGPTASRTMRPDEQVFLTRAFRELRKEFEKYPFHIHGEAAVVGNSRGEVNQTNYSPVPESYVDISKGDKYHLHTHPPFQEPFTSSASALDHRTAAEVYTLHGNKMGTYVTNGKDVLHIQADSTELVKLVPDAEVEKKLGKFPEAYRLPVPQPPLYPFANHEAPGALKSGRLIRKNPPEGQP